MLLFVVCTRSMYAPPVCLIAVVHTHAHTYKVFSVAEIYAHIEGFGSALCSRWPVRKRHTHGVSEIRIRMCVWMCVWMCVCSVCRNCRRRSRRCRRSSMVDGGCFSAASPTLRKCTYTNHIHTHTHTFVMAQQNMDIDMNILWFVSRNARSGSSTAQKRAASKQINNENRVRECECECGWSQMREPPHTDTHTQANINKLFRRWDKLGACTAELVNA